MGCGTAAPWPMPVATLVAAAVSRPGSQLPARVCVGMGVAVLVGTLSEPVTWGRRPLSGSVALAIALHLVSGVALVLAGGRRVRTPRTPRS